MPLKKLTLKAGVNRENTRYTSENGWYESDKVRFRQGTPEKIGGWNRVSGNSFVGVCRSLWNWVTLASQSLIGVGTNLKFYISNGGAYYDITPVQTSRLLGSNPFSTNSGSPTVTVTDASGGFVVGQYVRFSGASTVAGLDLSDIYEIKTVSSTTFTITASGNASSTTTGGGSACYALYELSPGPAVSVPLTGWGAGTWSSGTWGVGLVGTDAMRMWSQSNFGEDLVFGPRGGGIYYWRAGGGYAPTVMTVTVASPAVVTLGVPAVNGATVSFYSTGNLPTGITPGTIYYVINASGSTCNLATTPSGSAITTSGTQSGAHYLAPNAVLASSLSGASSVPLMQNYIMVSDTSRFVFAFGTNDYGSTVQNPMLLRWSDQESVTEWAPSATNQAGSLLLSHGSKIVTALQTRQEIVVFTDSSLYSLQYLGAPVVWGSQLLGDNVSIAGPNAVAVASGAVYWMGVDKFYKYDGRVQTLRCDLRQFIYEDINLAQADQIFASTNEGFNEVWFFYCSQNSETIDRYVVYNYVEDNGNGVWYYGTMARTAWLDSGLINYPIAATYLNNLVYHEYGVDDNSTGTTAAIDAYISSAEFDIDDGDHFGFVWRMLPDITFRGSEIDSPQAVMTLLPMQNSGSGYNDPTSLGGSDNATITRTATVPIEKFTGQVYVRVRGRQMILKVESTQIGCTWQLGSPRIDIRQDGRR